jgi:SWI/SNF-related matrix-associated actin-dependent regulator of chromatin subfamily A3
VRAKKPVNTPQLRVNKLPVLFNNINGTLSPQALDDPTSLEILCPNTARILSELEATAEIATQLYCHSKSELLVAQRVEHKGRRKAKGARSWYLNIILYGPTDLDEVVGDFLTKRRMYLQDPLGCDRRVLYQNPHVMPPEMDGEVMTDSFPYSLGNLEIERLEVGPDLLEQLMEDEAPLPETDPPKIVATRLFPYVAPPSPLTL